MTHMRGALAAALLLAAAACGNSSPPAQTTGTGGTFDIGMAEAIQTLNPVNTTPPDYLFFAYDPLIWESPKGDLVPDLATSWGFTDSQNKVFQLKLRANVKFSDGAPLTATAVKAWMDYFLKQNGPQLPNAGPVDTVTAVDSQTLQIAYKQPYPPAAVSLTQDWNFGDVVGPQALANPASLETTSDGAGQYILSAAETVAGSVYAFTRNSNYWNPSAIKYSKVRIHPLTDANAELAALQSGQIQYAQNLPASNAPVAKAAGIKWSTGLATWSSLVLEDRTKPPLSIVGVRQALNFAVDRAALAKTVYGGYATPLAEPAVPGQQGYSPADANLYSYDVTRAKTLLATAGYPNGFSINVLDAGALDKNGTLGAALQSQLETIGVKVNLTVDSGSFQQFIGDLFSKKFQAVVFPVRTTDTYRTWSLNLVGPGPINAYNLDDSALDTLVATAATSPSAQQGAAFQKVTHYLADQAWFVPIAALQNLQMYRPTVHNVAAQYNTVDLDPASPDAGQAWYSS